MRKYLFPILLSLLAVAVHAQYQFTPEKSMTGTPVQDQQGTNTCWSFATASFLESELLRAGKLEVNLSEMYMVRQIYLDKARNYILRQGKANFAEGGLAHDVTHAIATYGAVPESVYPGKPQDEVHNHAELVTVLKSVLDGMLAKKVVSEKWPAVVNAILDVYLGEVPESFKVGTQSFTPSSYAQSLNIATDEYVNITSFTHHPFYEKFVLEIPDNHANGSYYNVTLDDLVKIARNAVDRGYTVAWDGDVSEPGFSAEQGIAVFPVSPAREDRFTRPGPEHSVLVTERQAQFENFTTTDDHLMHITGIARDQNGARYFVVKNSWGVIGAYDGYLHMSEPYFRAKTISIMVHKDAIPMDIASRIAF